MAALKVEFEHREELFTQVMADFGQSDFGQQRLPIVGLTDSGQTDFGQF